MSHTDFRILVYDLQMLLSPDRQLVCDSGGYSFKYTGRQRMGPLLETEAYASGGRTPCLDVAMRYFAWGRNWSTGVAGPLESFGINVPQIT
jgi:hypothetical protein